MGVGVFPGGEAADEEDCECEEAERDQAVSELSIKCELRRGDEHPERSAEQAHGPAQLLATSRVRYLEVAHRFDSPSTRLGRNRFTGIRSSRSEM
jgi:hypothetical protein